MNNSPSPLQVLGAVWAVVVWLSSSSWSPCAPLYDISDRFSFCVKGGLVIKFLFWVCTNDGLGSFVGWPIFIFSPSPLGSNVVHALLVPLYHPNNKNVESFLGAPLSLHWCSPKWKPQNFVMPMSLSCLLVVVNRKF